MNNEIDWVFAAVDNNDCTALEELLVKYPIAVDANGATPLLRSVLCSDRSLDCLCVLLATGSNIHHQDKSGYKVLHYAVTHLDPGCGASLDDVISRLIAASANIESRQHLGWTPLVYAILGGDVEDVEILLKYGANPFVNLPAYTAPSFLVNRTSLVAALLSNHEMLKMLLDAGANPLLKDGLGQTLIEYANDQIPSLTDTQNAEHLERGVEITRDHIGKR